jgi:putative ABC transport system permease protein
MLGLYGLLAFVIRRRTHEVGVRMALGAQKKDVMLLVVRQGGLLVAIGVALGLAAAYAATSLVGAMLYGVSGRDPLTFAAVSLLLGLVALLAIYIPARHAARVEPTLALRHE